jgi:CRAL/TRIO domain
MLLAGSTLVRLSTVENDVCLCFVWIVVGKIWLLKCTSLKLQWLDYVTRTTGWLTKAIRIVDVKGMSLSKVNRECLKRNARYINTMEDCYPQLLQSLYFCHAPALFQNFWTTFRPILPKRLVSKVDLIDPEHRPSDCCKLLQHIDEEHLPERFGGKNKTWPVLTTLPAKQ